MCPCLSAKQPYADKRAIGRMREGPGFEVKNLVKENEQLQTCKATERAASLYNRMSLVSGLMFFRDIFQGDTDVLDKSSDASHSE